MIYYTSKFIYLMIYVPQTELRRASCYECSSPDGPIGVGSFIWSKFHDSRMFRVRNPRICWILQNLESFQSKEIRHPFTHVDHHRGKTRSIIPAPSCEWWGFSTSFKRYFVHRRRSEKLSDKMLKSRKNIKYPLVI